MERGWRTGLAALLDRILDGAIAFGLPLVLLISLLLCLQWPLRDLLQAYSRESNDLAQLLFALYVSIAITYATRRHSHLAADALAHHYPPVLRARLAQAAALIFLVPWAGFLLYLAVPIILQSAAVLERFPETANPGYFILRSALGLLALLIPLQALRDLLRGPEKA
jgi:TRAP-type C4-dicarboxylate transport system permease small subunit